MSEIRISKRTFREKFRQVLTKYPNEFRFDVETDSSIMPFVEIKDTSDNRFFFLFFILSSL